MSKLPPPLPELLMKQIMTNNSKDPMPVSDGRLVRPTAWNDEELPLSSSRGDHGKIWEVSHG